MYHGTYKHAGKKKPTRRKYGDVDHLPLNEKKDRLPLSDASDINGPNQQQSAVFGHSNTGIEQTRTAAMTSHTPLTPKNCDTDAFPFKYHCSYNTTSFPTLISSIPRWSSSSAIASQTS